MTDWKKYHLIVKGKIKGIGTKDQMWKRGQMIRPFTTDWSVSSVSKEISNLPDMDKFLEDLEEELQNDE